AVAPTRPVSPPPPTDPGKASDPKKDSEPKKNADPTPEREPKNDGPTTFVGHTGPAVKVVVSPDGKYALSCGGLQGDKTIRLWNFITGKELRQLKLRSELPFKPLQC